MYIAHVLCYGIDCENIANEVPLLEILKICCRCFASSSVLIELFFCMAWEGPQNGNTKTWEKCHYLKVKLILVFPSLNYPDIIHRLLAEDEKENNVFPCEKKL